MVLRTLQHRGGRRTERYAVVDLVRDQQRAVVLAPGGDGCQLLGGDDGPGGVRGRRHHQPGGRHGQCLQHLDGRLESTLGTAVDLDDMAAVRREHIAVGRVAGPGHHDLIARIEGRQNDRGEPSGRSGRHLHAFRIDLDTVVGEVVRGDLFAQLEQSARVGVSEGRSGRQRPGSGLKHRGGRAVRRLSQAQRNDIRALGTLDIGELHQLHRVERLDLTTS